jgi:hypothetical protein
MMATVHSIKVNDQITRRWFVSEQIDGFVVRCQEQLNDGAWEDIFLAGREAHATAHVATIEMKIRVGQYEVMVGASAEVQENVLILRAA